MTTRVLLLTSRFRPAPSVAAVRWTAFSDALADHDVELGVVCARYDDDPPSRDPLVVLELDRRSGAAGSAPAPVVAPPAPSRRGARAFLAGLVGPASGWLTWNREREAVDDAVRRFAPDLLVSTMPPHGLGLFGAGVARRHGVPFVADFRDPWVGDGRYDRSRVPPLPQVNRTAEARVVRAARVVVTAGAAHREELVDRYPDRRDDIVHVPNGFHAPSSAAPTSSGPFELAVVGQASAPELEAVVEAAARWFGDRPWRLRTIGLPDAQVSALRRLATVIDHPWVPADEIPDLLGAADLLVLALDPFTAGGGGTSTKLYQYVASGRPMVVVNATAANRVLLDRWARYRAVAGTDVGELDEAIAQLVTEPGPAPDLAAFLAEYSWAGVTARLAAALRRAASRP